MPRTAADNRQWFLNRATEYENLAARTHSPKERETCKRLAEAARTHAATYSLPANG